MDQIQRATLSLAICVFSFSSSLNLLAVDKQQNSVFPPPTGMECGSK